MNEAEKSYTSLCLAVHQCLSESELLHQIISTKLSSFSTNKQSNQFEVETCSLILRESEKRNIKFLEPNKLII